MIQFKLFGDWKRATATFRTLDTRIKNAGRSAIREEGIHLRYELTRALFSNALPWPPLDPMTVALRKQHDLRAVYLSQLVFMDNKGYVFIGVQGERAKLVELHTHGATYTRQMTKKQRGFLAAMMKRRGAPAAPATGSTTVVIRPRPWVGPVVEREWDGDAKQRRFEENFLRASKGIFSRR